MANEFRMGKCSAADHCGYVTVAATDVSHPAHIASCVEVEHTRFVDAVAG